MVADPSASESRRRGLVAKFIDERQREGRYTFTDSALGARTPQNFAARRQALWRFQKAGRIIRPLPRHDFFVIVPHEYHSLGAPPSSWYLDSLLRYLDLPTYYVALLTAAQWHGASHLPVQETQVVVPKQLRPIHVGRELIRFFTKSSAADTPVETKSTEVGSVRVSTAEATAADLVRYPNAAGGLNMTATVLAELLTHLTARELLSTFKTEGDVATAQRLGYLLEALGGASSVKLLRNWIVHQHPRSRPLDTQAPSENVPFDALWKLWINARVEPSI